jgi:hypothetical protein
MYKINPPLALCHWKKNLNVRSRPITQARPDRNKICHKNDVVIYVYIAEKIRMTGALKFPNKKQKPVP